jgi:glutathione S-transferase
VQGDVARIEEMWSRLPCALRPRRAFLFGAPCAADAMYAPVVSRFHTYDIAVGEDARAYMQR